MKKKYICKCCWFETLLMSYWDCDLCSICWRTDTFNNFFPYKKNLYGKNLIIAQQEILKKIPLDIQEYKWYTRNSKWKKININDIKNINKPYIEKWYYNEIIKDWDYISDDFYEAQKYNPTKY